MAVRVTRCYSYFLTGTRRIKQCGRPPMLLLQGFSRAPNLSICSSTLFTSVSNNLNSKTTFLVRYSFRNWLHNTRPRLRPPRTQRSIRRYSNEAGGGGQAGGSNSSTPAKALSYTERIKVVLREYGTVAVVFHTAISLFSLGSCYLVVSSGVDVEQVLKYFNIETSGTKTGASTFALAYVLHKVLLPLRATITVVSVPVIVRQLRARGWMKGAVKKVTKRTK